MSDNISRQAAIDEIQPFGEYESNKTNKEWVRLFTIVLKQLPSTDQWIPCSERLPEEHEWIGTKLFGTTISDNVHITFDVNGERFIRTLPLQNGELSSQEKYIMDTFYKGWKMIAWMPLPEPYSKER